MLSALVGLWLAGSIAPAEISAPPVAPIPNAQKNPSPPAQAVSDAAIRRLVERATKDSDDGQAAAAALLKVGARAVPFIIERLAKPTDEGYVEIDLAYYLVDFGYLAKAPMLKALADGNEFQKVGISAAFSVMAARLAPHPHEMPEGESKPEKGSEEDRLYGFVLEADVVEALRANLRLHSRKVGSFNSADFFAYVASDKAIDDLIAATYADDYYVAADALAALLWILDEPDLPRLRAIFDRIYTNPTKDTIIEDGNDNRLIRLVYGMREGTGLRRALLLDLLTHPTAKVRGEIIIELERKPIIQARAKLDAIHRNDPEVILRRVALVALVKMFPKMYLPRVTEYASAPATLDRACAALAAHHLPSTDGLPLLLKMAGDPEPKVRQRVAESLWSFPGAETEAALKKLLKDPDPTVRAAASQPPED